jgi:hypothetical protein
LVEFSIVACNPFTRRPLEDPRIAPDFDRLMRTFTPVDFEPPEQNPFGTLRYRFRLGNFKF